MLVYHFQIGRKSKPERWQPALRRVLYKAHDGFTCPYFLFNRNCFFSYFNVNSNLTISYPLDII